MTTDKPGVYAAAVIGFLDRENMSVESSYCYPITKVVLKQRDNPENERTFVVTEAGAWKEI